MEPARKLKAEAVDDRKIGDPELDEHTRRSWSAGPHAVGEELASRESISSLNCRLGLAPINFSTG